MSDIIHRSAVLNKTNGVCAKCGCKLTLQSLSIDHYIPISKGGSNYFDNLYPMCIMCNREKQDDVYDWEECYPHITYQYANVLNKLYNKYMDECEQELPESKLSKTQRKRLEQYYDGMIVKTCEVRHRPEFHLVKRDGVIEFYETVTKTFQCNFDIGEEYTYLMQCE